MHLNADAPGSALTFALNPTCKHTAALSHLGRRCHSSSSLALFPLDGGLGGNGGIVIAVKQVEILAILAINSTILLLAIRGACT
jgi:hypothetical protein